MNTRQVRRVLEQIASDLQAMSTLVAELQMELLRIEIKTDGPNAPALTGARPLDVDALREDGEEE